MVLLSCGSLSVFFFLLSTAYFSMPLLQLGCMRNSALKSDTEEVTGTTSLMQLLASSVLNFADGLQIGTDRAMFLCISAWHPSVVLHVQVPSGALKALQAATFLRTLAHWTQ